MIQIGPRDTDGSPSTGGALGPYVAQHESAVPSEAGPTATRLFICHASEDADLAKELVARR